MYKVRVCEICGEEFLPKGSKDKYCKKPIEKICPVCGDTFMSFCHKSAPTTCGKPDCKKKAGYVASTKPIRRICRVCGEPFEATNGNQKDCNKQITKICPICGKEFSDYCRVQQTMTTCGDPSCLKKYQTNARQSYYAETTQICILCGKEFHPINNTQKVCMDTHYRNCVICGKRFEIPRDKIKNIAEIAKTCSPECKTKASFLQGNPGQRPECREKAKQTLRKNYGVDHPMHSEEIKKKVDATSQDRYGAKRFVQTEAYIEKAVATNRERYGTDWARQNPEIQEKAENTLFKHFGVYYPAQSEEIKAKTVANYRARTGYDYPAQNPEVAEKTRNTNRDRYGYDNVFASPVIRNKSKDTMKLRYGVDSPQKSEKIREKTRHTNVDRYGYANPVQSPKVQAKIANTMRDRYGVNHYNESWDYRKSIMSDPTKVEDWKAFLENPESYISAHFDHKPNYRELENALGVNESTIGLHLARQHKPDLVQYTSSYAENDLLELLRSISPSMEIEVHNRSIITPYEIDVYLPEFKFGIELNPTSTHNSSVAAFGNKITPPSYHRMKTDMCERQGVFLFHIFGYEWSHKRNIIASMIRNLTNNNLVKIYARKCEFRQVPGKEAFEFLQANHRQGGVHSKIRYGLYYDGELVSLMTFGKMRNTLGIGNEDLSDCWELVRFCNKLNTTVIGGASRLFKHFIDDYKPTRVRSFSDRAHTRGGLYATLGFTKVNQNKESYVWVNLADNKAYSRIVAQKHNLKQFFKDDTLDLSKTEREIMESHGYAQVYDSGTITWQWKP